MKSRTKVLSLLITTFVIIGIISGLSVKSQAASDVCFTRMSGQSRYETAVEISKNGWDHSDAVVLTCGENFPDGLTGVTLAYSKNAPILLSAKDQLPQATLSEIQRLAAKDIYILGGVGAISTNVEQQLKSLNYNVIRVCGTSRFQTAIEVGKLVKNSGTDTVVIANAFSFPDALAVGPGAARNNMPILFTDQSSLTPDTKQTLVSWNIKKVVIVGGTGAVSTQVESQIKALGISVERLCGTDRYTTALSIAKRFNTSNSQNIVLANGENFPDALAGGALAAKNNFPIVLTSRDDVSADVLSYFDNLKAQDMYLLGGTGAISDNVKDQVKNGTYGNTEANIVNSGYAVKQGDWIYYYQYDPAADKPEVPNNCAIYKMKSDGSCITKLVNVQAMDLNIKGDWLYYFNEGDNKIYKIKTDGSHNQLVINMIVSPNMIIVGDWIYCSSYYSGILKIKVDGSDYTSVWGDGSCFVVSGNTVYFSYRGDNCSLWTSNSANNKLNSEPSYDINVYRDRIYYRNAQGDICSISTSGGDKTIIGNNKTTCMMVDEGWIYYSNNSDNGKLYKMKVDGTCGVKVIDSTVAAFNIVGDWIVNCSNAQTHFVKK